MPCLAVLALAGCADAPPAAAPLPPPSLAASNETPAPVPTVAQPQRPPPLAVQVTNVLDSRSTQVPGHPNCTDYRVTGTLQGAVRTVTGRSCRLPDGGLTVTERNPITGQTTTQTYPAPPTGVGAASAADGSTSPDAGYYGSAALGADYPYGGFGYYGFGAAYPFAFYDPFFFGYPFFGFGFGCCGFGHGYGRGGFGHGYGYGHGYGRGGYGFSGGEHGAGGGFGGGGFAGGGFHGGGFSGGGGGGHR